MNHRRLAMQPGAELMYQGQMNYLLLHPMGGTGQVKAENMDTNDSVGGSSCTDMLDKCLGVT